MRASLPLIWLGSVTISVGIGFVYWPAGVIAAGILVCLIGFVLIEVPDATD